MNTEQPRALAVRLDRETINRVQAFAERNGLVNEGGTLNISAALRVLISTGLGSPTDQITLELWQSARGVVMREVVDTVLGSLKEYRDNNYPK
jgi:hypothetical protein